VAGETIDCMGKIRRFFAEAGALGVASVSFGVILWIIAAIEHSKDKNIPAIWFLLIGCLAFCIGSYLAWSKADDRANERKPKLGFSADRQGFYLSHLEGETARFIQIELSNPGPTKLHFDPVDFIGGGKRTALTFRLEIVPGERTLEDMGKVLLLIFSSHTKAETEYPITLRFKWNRDSVEEKVLLRWISEDKRFETMPQ
jgi:hypothetical protein